MAPTVAMSDEEGYDIGSTQVLLATDLQLHIQFLKDIHPSFTEALTTEYDLGCKPFIRAKLAEIGLLVGPLTIPYNLTDVPAALIERCWKYLHETLNLLEILMSPPTSIRVLEIDLQADQWNHDTRYPKLTTLRDFVSSQYHSRQTEGRDSHDQYSSLRARVIEFFPNFDKEKRLVEAMTQLIATLHRMIPLLNNTGIPDVVVDQNQTSTDVHVAKQAQTICRQLDTLLRLMSNNLDPCGLDHTAGIELSNFFNANCDIRLLLSTCTREPQQVWYPIHCKRDYESENKLTKPFQLCPSLQRCRPRLMPVHLTYSTTTISASKTHGRARLNREDILSSFTSLSNFLKEENGATRKALLRRGDRRRLQCLLSLSLLYLFKNAWFEGAWNPNGILFPLVSNSSQFKTPYAFGRLKMTSSFGEKSDGTEDWDVGIFMASFGLLLLEIEFQERLELSEEEKQEEFGVEIALDRHIKAYKGDIEDPLLKVLLVCLDFNAFVEDLEDPSLQEDDLKHRLVIYQNILTPIKDMLTIGFPEIASKIPDIQEIRDLKSDCEEKPSSVLKQTATRRNISFRARAQLCTINEEPRSTNASTTPSRPATALPVVDSPENGIVPRHHDYLTEDSVPWIVTTRLGHGLNTIIEKVHLKSTTTPTQSLPAQFYARKLIVCPSALQAKLRFLNDISTEANIMKSLTHRHIVRLHSTYTLKNEFAIIMSPVGDMNLAEYLASDTEPGSQSDSHMRCWFGCLAMAFAYLHAKKIKHRDVKPGNILIKGSEVVLTDFGISKDAWEDMSTKTTGRVDRRTEMYCSPEVEEWDERGRSSDVFSLGCVFLEMVTHLLREHGCTVERLHQQVTAEYGVRSYCKSMERVLHWIRELYSAAKQPQNVYGAGCARVDGVRILPALEWCLAMLLPDPNQRITAELLAAIIARTDTKVGAMSGAPWIGPCCGHDAERLLPCTPLSFEWPWKANETTISWDIIESNIKIPRTENAVT